MFLEVYNPDGDNVVEASVIMPEKLEYLEK
jgi:hypothetical protein